MTLAEAQFCTRVSTSALIHPSGWLPVQSGLPRVWVEEWYCWFQVGWLVQREEVPAAVVSQMVHDWLAQSVLPEWKFHSARFVSTISASWIGVVFQWMKDRAVRGVPSALVVPGLPKSSSVSVDRSVVSPCCTYVSNVEARAEVEGSTVTGY